MENDLSLRQLDISTAFLNGDVNEEIYMDQPEGFIEEKSKDKVCKLSKSIYGLKQAGSQWFLKIDEVIKQFGLQQSKYDQCLYYLKKRDIVLIVALYVDDIIMASNNENTSPALCQTGWLESKNAGYPKLVPSCNSQDL